MGDVGVRGNWLLIVGRARGESGGGLLALGECMGRGLDLGELLLPLGAGQVELPLELNLELLSGGVAALCVLAAALLHLGDVLAELVAPQLLSGLALLFRLGDLALLLLGLLEALHVESSLALCGGPPALLRDSRRGGVEASHLPAALCTLELL